MWEKGRILTILLALNKPQGLITPDLTVSVDVYGMIQGHFFFFDLVYVLARVLCVHMSV